MGLGGVLRFAKNQVKAVLPGVAADKKKPWIPGPPDAKPVLAPPPTSAASSLAAPNPPDANAAASSAIGAAVAAAKKIRRKNATPGLGGNIKPSSIATGAMYAPRSLIGL